MLSAHTSYQVNKKNPAFAASHTHTHNHSHHPVDSFFASESPVTQDSSSMGSITDEYDFKSTDISSSAQTSTNSPIRLPEMRNGNASSGTSNARGTKFSSFSFYSGPPIDAKGNNNKKHASQFRRSLVISPSFNSISSNQNVETPTDTFDDSFDDSRIASTLSDPAETPTKNIGMVISPSIRALSDILTSKVAQQKNTAQPPQHATISEETDEIENDDGDDDDNSTILLKSAHRQPSSLIDDIYSPQRQSCGTFHKTTSDDTLKIYVPPKGTISDANSQPDLIDLNTPVVEHTNFANSSFTTAKSSLTDPNNTNYSDLFESYSPVKGDASYEEQNFHYNQNTNLNANNNDNDNSNTTIAAATTTTNYHQDYMGDTDKRFSNRFSMMSENMNDFQSPALGYNEPVQSFNFINPSRSFSKLSNISDSFHEIGYGNDTETFGSGSDFQESAFSFVPSKAGTLTKQKNEAETKEQQQPVFTQKPSVRDSIRIVNEEDEDASLISDGVTSPDLKFSSSSTPVLNPNFDNDKTPKIGSVPNLGYTHHTEARSAPQLRTSERPRAESPQRSLFNSPVLLNSSPIRNTSPTFENFKNSPTEENKRKFINLTSGAQLPKSPRAKSPVFNKPAKSPKINQSKPAYNTEKLQPAKPKQKKLTFKSIFSKSHENQSPQNTDLKKKSPLLHSDEKFSRPKSFSFNNLGHNNNNNNSIGQVKHEERKEKSKSLLSSWKRKSLGFTNQNKKEKTKSSSFFQTSQTDASPKNTNTHRKTQSNASLPMLSRPVPSSTRQAPSSPHKHSNSTPTIFTKELPNLPPPSSKPVTTAQNSNSLLQTYGFNQASPDFSQTPIISQSPNINSLPQRPPSPVWEGNPEVIRSASEQTIQTANSPIDLPEPQSAKIDEYSPVPYGSASFGRPSPVLDSVERLSEKDNSNNNDSSLAFNSSSTYETTEVDEDSGISFFKPPKALGISERSEKSSPIALGVTTLDDNLLRTPPSIASPAFSVVASFTASPNRYHIGDDMFPKKLGVDEIESIVSLERSRSMRSVRSAVASERQRISHKNSILRMVQDNNDDFDEMVLPDGMVVVKSPLTDQSSLLSRGTEGDPARKSSILKNRVNVVTSQPKTQLYNNTVKRDSMNFDDNSILNGNSNDGLVENDDFNEFIDMINFDDDDDLDNLNTSFNLDTSMNVKLSPVHQIQRDSSVPDFLGVETSYNSIQVADTDVIQKENDLSREGFSGQLMYNAPDSADSIDDIIKEEENLHKHKNYSAPSLTEPQHYQPAARPISGSFKGLSGPSFNSSLKPETKSAILGVLAKKQPLHSVVASDSDSSLSNANYVNNYSDQTNYDYRAGNSIQNTPQESSYDNYNDYANYYENNSPRQASPQTNQRYSLNNPFTDYSQSYEDVGTTDSHVNNRYEQTNDMANKRKSLNFMGKLNTNKFGHFSTSSLPTTLPLHEDEKDKPKFLTKRRNRTSVSFGRLGMFDSIIPHNGEGERPNVKFSSRILLYDTYGEDEYDRKPDSSTCNNLTPQLAMDIKNELNQLKSEMPVHEDSRRYTHFF